MNETKTKGAIHKNKEFYEENKQDWQVPSQTYQKKTKLKLIKNRDGKEAVLKDSNEIEILIKKVTEYISPTDKI